MEKIGCGAIVVWILIVVIIGIGWIKCIIKEINCDWEAPYKAEAVYGVGIVIPVAGGIIGWMDIKDGKVTPVVTPADSIH